MTHFKFFALLCIFFSFSSLTKGAEKIAKFEELNQCIENRIEFKNNKLAKINALRNELKKNNSISQTFDLYSKLYEEYKAFKYDSAYAYSYKMLTLAKKIDDINLIAKSKIALSYSCRSAGLYKEANELLYSIDSTNLSTSVKTDMYAYKAMFNLELAQFFVNEPYFSLYNKESFECCKKTVQIADHEDVFVNNAKARIYQFNNDYQGAIKLAKHYLSKKKPNEHDYAMIAADIASYYMTLKDTAQAINYYTQSAMADIQSATTETSAITNLANIYYKKSDFKKAHICIMQALEDAEFYNARQRKVQVSNIFPIIEAERFQVIQQQKNNLLIYLAALSLLLVLLSFAVFVILKQTSRLNKAKKLIQQQNVELLDSNKELTKSQEKIQRQNNELLLINEKLKETQRIKEEYIGYFFSANSSYLEKMEEYRKLVARKIKNKQAEELLQINSSTSFQQERENMFDLFDQIFLKLFPDFVNQYNQLFNPEDRVILKNEHILNAELRIFALIRLGISESERIAQFLDYSVHTVNNYKTKVKNRSFVPNELFEQRIMQIESIKTDIER